MKRPPLSEAMREIEEELISETRQTSYVGPQDYAQSPRTAADISAFTTYQNYLSAGF